MEIYEFTQIAIVVGGFLVVARLGLALARRIERRPADSAPALGEDRVRALEEECAILRRELSEVQERQDFTERLLLRDPHQDAAPSARAPTPR
jgi:hypothetical protein